MKKELQNTFSWSVSRDSVFRECLRKYYFNYYGHWGGWQTDAGQRTRQIYVLKNLKNRATWIGQVVHACIARSLQNLSRGVPLLTTEEIKSITLSGMRQDFRDSRDGRYWQNPRIYHGFFEHEHNIEVSDDEWKESANMVDRCLTTFYESEQFKMLKAMKPRDYLEVEQFSKSHFEGVEISNKLDCATREGDLVVVWDWKTGRRETDSGVSLQMACYAYYAKHAFHVDLERIETRRFDLYRNKVYADSIGERAMEEMLDYVRGSIKDMRGLLDDAERNTAREERFRKVEKASICLKCNFFKVCMPSI